MDTLTYVLCTSCLLLLYITLINAVYFDELDRMKTDHRVDILHNGQEDFPDTVQMVLTSPKTTLLFNYTKTSTQFNIPMYVYNNRIDHYDVLDIGEVKDSMIYEDKVHETILTFHCHDIEPHTKQPCTLQSVFGIFYLDGYQHFIQPEEHDIEFWRQTTKKNQRKNHILQHHVYKTVGLQNYSCTLENNNELNLEKSQNSAHRMKRAVQNTKKRYTIEVLALMDENKWVENKSYDEGLKEMQTYYAHVFNGVDKLYGHIKDQDSSFSVKLVGIVLFSNMTDDIYLQGHGGGFYIDGSRTLNNLTNERGKRFPDFDHVLMFSRYKVSSARSTTLGIANVGAMCGKQSVSVVVETGGFQEVFIAAHEIGHSLNSTHDGESNQCQKSDSYIMSAIVVKNQTQSQKLNSFLFSHCSIKTIKTFVQQIKNKCLEKEGIPFGIVPVVSRPTGQVYSPQEQCRTLDGSEGLCPSVFNQKLSHLCLHLQCLRDATTCRQRYAAHKTSCGNKKWCVFGKCKYDVAAPEMDETCPFGDNKNLRFTVVYPSLQMITPHNCTHFIKLVPDVCAQSDKKAHCCKTCKQNNKGNKESATTTNLTNFWCLLIYITYVISVYLF